MLLQAPRPRTTGERALQFTAPGGQSILELVAAWDHLVRSLQHFSNDQSNCTKDDDD